MDFAVIVMQCNGIITKMSLQRHWFEDIMSLQRHWCEDIMSLQRHWYEDIMSLQRHWCEDMICRNAMGRRSGATLATTQGQAVTNVGTATTAFSWFVNT